MGAGVIRTWESKGEPEFEPVWVMPFAHLWNSELDRKNSDYNVFLCLAQRR